MPDELSFLDQLEEWLEHQVPPNLQDLPLRMLETMERVSVELYETLSMHGPPSISIPFPPFGAKEVLPPPPPPPPRSMTAAMCRQASEAAHAHPYITGAGAALAVTVGLGVGGAILGFGPGGYYARQWRLQRRFRMRGLVDDGMLRETIVLLSPSPMPPLLWVMAVSLLRAGYIVVVAVPHVEDAEALEKRLSVLDEKSALRVLIYDPEDSATFPPFHRSLLATLTLRFPAQGKSFTGDPYNPQPTQLPRIHAFISLYPLHPNPSSQPGALPALPTLLAAEHNRGKAPKLITLYPSSSILATPDSFATQLLAANHLLLSRNLVASSASKIVSVYLGNLELPNLQVMLGEQASHRPGVPQRGRGILEVARAHVSHVLSVGKRFYSLAMSNLGIGAAAQDYGSFEKHLLWIIKARFGTQYHFGQYSWLPFILASLPLPVLPRILSVLPIMPNTAAEPPFHSTQSLPVPRKQFSTARPAARSPGSTSSSEHDSGEDLATSFHSRAGAASGHTATSRPDSRSRLSGKGKELDESWIGLEANGEMEER